MRAALRNPSALISSWEVAASNIPFSIQHRYEVLSNTFSGVIHLVSLFYANVRDQSDPSISEEHKRKKLEENRQVALATIALGKHVSALTAKLETMLLAKGADGSTYNPDHDQSLRAINEMTHSFSEITKSKPTKAAE
jgi:hypothetical protein